MVPPSNTCSSDSIDPLQRGTSTLLAVGQDQPLSVQDFLRSLKKSKRLLPTLKPLEAPQHDTFQNGELTVQGFLQGLRKPVTPTCEPAKGAEAPRFQNIASASFEDLSLIDAAAGSGPGLLDSPESSPNETDSEQDFSEIPEVKRLQFHDLKDVDEKDGPIKVPKVTRTYTKKAKHVPAQQNDSPPLFFSQTSAHEGALYDGSLDDGSDFPTERLASRSIPKTKEKHTSAVPQKRKRQPPQDREENHRDDHSGDDVDIVTKEKRGKTKRKKRRVPVNELELVTRLSSQQRSPANDQVRQLFVPACLFGSRCIHGPDLLLNSH